MYVVRQVTWSLTSVWLSDAAMDFIEAAPQPQRVWAKLGEYCKAGFWNLHGEGRPIRPEGDGIFRVRIDTLRLIGFYVSAERREFITLEVFEKHTEKLTKPQRGVIKRAQKTLRQGEGIGWTRSNSA